MNFFKKLFGKNRVRVNNSQTFILEPILTPSALIDVETGEETPDLDSDAWADIALSTPEESLSEEGETLEKPLEVEAEETVYEIEEELPFFTSLPERMSAEDGGSEIGEPESDLNLENDSLEPEELSLYPEHQTPNSLPEIELGDEEVSPTETEETDKALFSEDIEPTAESEENLESDAGIQATEPMAEPGYLDVEGGYFVVGESGLLQVNFILDGGKYKGEVGLFSLREMAEIEPDSPEFIFEAATRILSDSDWGTIAISDRTEGAKLDELVESSNWNSGEYLGEKTLSFKRGDRLGIMLAPKGSIEQVLNNPEATGARAPLFSLEGTALVKIGDDGCGYGWEDVDLERKSDRDYNDIIFTLKGATPVGITPIENLIDTDANWQETEAGERIISELQCPHLGDEPPPNRPPEVSSLPLVDSRVNQEYEYQVLASDPDGDNLTYSITAPEGLEIDSAGKITWTPNSQQVGVYQVTVSISDSKAGEVEQHYSILVQPEAGNTAPVIISQPQTKLAISPGEAPGIYQYDVNALDADNDNLVYGLVDAPEEMSINPETGEITWQAPHFSFSQEVTVEVKDGRGGVDRQTYTIDLSQTSGSLSGQIYAQGETQVLYTNDFEDTQQPLSEWENGRYDDKYPTRSFLGTYGGSHPSIGDRYQTRLNLSNLPEHSQVTLDFDLYVLDSWSGGEHLGPDGWKLQVVDGEILLNTTFGSGYQFGENALPQAYPNNVEDGILHPGGTGAFKTDATESLGFTPNMWGNAIYDLSFTFDHTDSELALDFIGDTDEDINNESWGLDNVRVSVSSKEGLAGWRVYLDQNNNGERDPGEPNTLTDANGNYTFTGLNPGDYTLRTEPKAGWNTTTPESSQHVVSLAAGETLTDLDFTQEQSAEEIENHPPEFTNLAPETASVGELWRYDATATDPDNDNLSYFLSVGPEGMSVDAETGTFVWTPTLEQGQQAHSVILGVDDSNGGIDLKAFQINTRVETPPVITSLPSSTPLNAGTPYEYQVEATDANLDALTFSVETNQPGITIDDEGLLNWETPVTGVHEVIITVEDGQGESATQTLTLEVVENAENSAPRILSSPRTTATIAQPYIAQVEAIDDNGDKLTYSLEAADELGITINEQGQIYWTPTQAEHLGTHEITLTVNDGRGSQDSQTFNLTVSNQSQNQRPEITAAPPNSATLGTQYRYPMQGSDPDGDLLLWSLDQAPSGMSIHATTGEITWTPTIEQLGEQEVAVRLTDSQGSYTGVIFTLTARGTNIAPLIISTPLTETSLGSEYLYQVLAADPDGDALTFSFDQAPDGMSINEHGVITWTPTTTGSEPISVLVTDSLGATTTHSYTLEVGANARNLAPTITSTPESYGSAPGQEYTYQLSAVDPEEGENVTYELLSSPDNLILDPQTGLLQWTPTPSQAGSHLVQVAAVDSQGLRGVQGFYLNVRNNSAPVILSAPNTELFEGQTFRYDIRAIDPDGDNLSYQLSQAPEGMTIDGQGRIFWDAREGTYDAIEATVTDEYGATVTQSIPLQVSLDEEKPQVSLFQSFDFAYPNQEVLFAVQGSDNLGIAEKGLTINGTPVPLDAWGSATWTFAAPGLYTIEATVIDKSGNETTETFEFKVNAYSGEGNIDFNLNLPAEPISEPTELKGTIKAIDAEGLDSYTVQVAPVGTNDFITLFEKKVEGNRNIEDGVLGTFDPTILANGAYTLRVVATDSEFIESYFETQVDVDSPLKLGNFQLSFTDLEIPVSGIPITVTRTYDSLYANEEDNFGHGWRLEFRDTNLQTSVAPPSPEQELLGRPNGFQEGDKVYITLPGGKRETFTFAPEIHPDVNTALRMGAPWPQSALFYVPKFVSEEGSGLTLSVKETSLLRKETGEYISPNGLGYNPSHYLFGGTYTLTTAEGIEYEIDATTGDLLQVTDLNGNQLNFSDSGIVSSTGVEVKFERDAQGRIEKVIDPEDNEVTYTYDEIGNLVEVIDAEDNKIEYKYDNPDNPHYLTEIIDPVENRPVVRAQYLPNGRLEKVFDIDGDPITFEYDLESNTQIIKDANGTPTLYEYDQRGNVVRQVNQINGITHETRLEYEGNNIVKVTDPNGNIVTYDYDNDGNLKWRTELHDPNNPNPATTYYTYNQYGQTTSIVMPSGVTAKMDYDPHGNFLGVNIGEDEPIISYTYDDKGRLTSETSDGSSHYYKDFDAFGNPRWIGDEFGEIATLTYNTKGQLETIVDADGTSTFTYDDLGREDYADYGNGVWVDYGYEGSGTDWVTMKGPTINLERTFTDDGRFQSWVLPEGEITFNYDKAGRLETQTNADGEVITTQKYDSLGRVEGIIDESTGIVTVLHYDEHYRVDGYEDPDPAVKDNLIGRLAAREVILPDEDNTRYVTHYTYHADGEVKTITDPRGNTWHYYHTQTTSKTIDPLGRKTTIVRSPEYVPTETRYADGTNETTEYLYNNHLVEATDYPTEITDRAGRDRDFTYDEFGRLKTATDWGDTVYTYHYNEYGWDYVESENGDALLDYDYNEQGELESIKYSDDGRQSFIYDPDTNALKQETLASGEVIDYEYDPETGLETRRVYSLNGKTLYEVVSDWNFETGQLLSVTDPTGTTAYHYDPDTGAFTGIDYPNNSNIRYQRDILGRVEKVTVKPNKDGTTEYVTEYEYDANGNIEKVTAPNTQATVMIYDEVNRLEQRTLPNGIKTVYTYKENTDFIEKIIHYSPDGVTVMSSIEYVRSDSGEPTKITREDGSYVELKYDESLRLEKETYYDANGVLEEEIAYSYDEAGNRQTVSSGEAQGDYDYENIHQLMQIDTSEGVETYHYDDGGRLETITRDGETWQLRYNSDDLIVEVKKGENIVVQYAYDTSGRRVEMTDAMGEKDYVVAPLMGEGLESPHLVMDGANNPLAAYVYAGTMPLMRLDDRGDPTYYLEDGMGSIIGLADNSGGEVAEFEYDSFGNLRNNPTGMPNELGGDFRFQGQWLESNTDFYHFRARYYDPETGRFVSRDPVHIIESEPESSNPYQFVYNNPHIYSDPSGEITITEISAAQALQDGLNALRTYGIAEAREKVQQKAFEAIGNAALNALRSFTATPVPPGAEIVIRNAIDGGRWFENTLKHRVCDLIPFDTNQLFLEVGVDSGGQPYSPGFTCPPLPRRAEQIRIERLGTRSGTGRPDFILTRPGSVPRRSRGNGRTHVSGGPEPSWIVGDIKLSMKTLFNDYVGSSRYPANKPNQWDAIMNYAAKNGFNVAGFLTMFGEGNDFEFYRRQVVRQALEPREGRFINYPGMGVGLLIATIFRDAKSPFR